MTTTSLECSDPTILKKAFNATKQGFVCLYDIVATGLDTCGRKVEELTYRYLPPTAAKIANYIIGALPVATFWVFTLVAPFYINLPLVAIYTLTLLAKEKDLSNKAKINIENGNGIGFTLAAVDMLKNLRMVQMHPAITISFIALEIIFAASCFIKSIQLMRGELKAQA